MLQTSTRTQSRSKHRIHIKKYNHQLSPNTSLTNLHHAQSSTTTPFSTISDKIRQSIYFHQHTHNHYLHQSPQLSSSTLCCEFNKFVIYLLLFLVAYYLLVLTISFTYKNQKHKHNYNPLTTLLSEAPKNIPDINIDYDNNNNNNNNNIQTDTKLISRKLEQNKSQRDKFLERKRTRREQRKSRLAALRGDNMDNIDPNHKKKSKKSKHKTIFLELEKFPDVYISDVPYYLENNIVIIGQLKNAELHLKSILAQLLSVSCLYNSTTFILFTSNSIDNTSLYLHEFLHAESDINCTQKMFNPTHVEKYGNMTILDELINIFDTSLEEYVADNNNSYVDDIMYGILSNYTHIYDIELKEIEWYLNEQIRLQNNALSDVDIEEIIYDKLAVIKYVRYHDSIINSMHNHQLYKYVIFGDEIVSDELEKELNILSLLNIYDGVNEFHTGDGIELTEKTQKNDKIHKLSDFEGEFNAIHNDIEGLIASDEEIIFEKLHEKRKKYAQKRMQLRDKKLRKLQNVLKEDEFYNKFRDKLYRIERFVAYRNMLLNETLTKSLELGIDFDYILMVDMDIYNIDIRTFMNELYYSSDDINGLCINGIDWIGYTRDTFATVDMNGEWLHYGHDPLANDTQYIYNNRHALNQRKLIPNRKENNRFYGVKSCFGGMVIYKNNMPQNDLFASQCRYTLTRDIFYTTYNDTNVEEYSYSWWFGNRYHNKYSEGSKLQLERFRKEYIEILQMENERIKDREKYPKDGDICEHIPFHYCLNDYGWKFAISSRAKLYYDKLYPVNRKEDDTNWKYYFNNRPSFTK